MPLWMRQQGTNERWKRSYNGGVTAFGLFSVLSVQVLHKDGESCPCKPASLVFAGSCHRSSGTSVIYETLVVVCRIIPLHWHYLPFLECFYFLICFPCVPSWRIRWGTPVYCGHGDKRVENHWLLLRKEFKYCFLSPMSAGLWSASWTIEGFAGLEKQRLFLNIKCFPRVPPHKCWNVPVGSKHSQGLQLKLW